MAYIYEQDVTKVGGNLQKTVAYLSRLHKNEYEWNLLGIRVIGVKEALPIPDGTYDYGDAYMIGNKTDGFELWIYTRADEFHTEAYWFNVGQFPKAGPQGPKGDGWDTAQLFQEGITTNLTYDSNNGGKNESISSMTYVDSTTGKRLTKNFQMVSRLPIIPGKYVSMNSTSDNKKIEVKVDDTALALDYYKMDKSQTTSTIPYWDGTKAGTLKVASDRVGNSVAKRDSDGDCFFNKLLINRLASTTGAYNMPITAAYYGGYSDGLTVEKTPTNTGTLTVGTLTSFKDYPNIGLKYDNQSYVRMDPTSAPDGTLNYIHLDSIEDGNGGYKATGKCFSINVSTRAWKVVNLDFGGKVYKHAIHFEVTGAGTTGNANVWDIELVITTSSPNQITKNTLYKYISTSNYPLQGGTPISVYRERVEDPAGLGIGRMAVHHEVGEISNTDHYIFELMSMDGISDTITERDQNSLSSFVDTVTEV